MKILHTADWHLGKKLDRFERLHEQAQALDEICQIADRENVDVVLIAGDLYDTYNPPIEATELFYKTVKRLANQGKRAVIAIAGNHDSPDRIEAPDPLARECGVILAGFPHSEPRPFALDSGIEITKSAPGFIELKTPNCDFPLRLLLTPYANEGRLRRDLGHDNPDEAMRDLLQEHWKLLFEEHCDNKGLNMLVAHLLMMSKGDNPPDENIEEEKAMGPASVVHTQNLPKGLQYAALGHIHTFRNMTGGPCPAVYASSPLAFSFPSRGQNNEAGKKHVVIVEGKPNSDVSFRPIELFSGLSLHRRQFASVNEALEWLRENQDCYVELHIETENFLNADERKQIMAAHPRVVGPIPIFKKKGLDSQAELSANDLDLGLEAMFRKFFLAEKGIEVNAELLELFREVVGKETGR